MLTSVTPNPPSTIVTGPASYGSAPTTATIESFTVTVQREFNHNVVEMKNLNYLGGDEPLELMFRNIRYVFGPVSSVAKLVGMKAQLFTFEILDNNRTFEFISVQDCY